MKMSALQLMRAAYKPQIPKALEGAVRVEEETALTSADDQETIKNLVQSGLGVSLVSERAARGAVEEKRLLQFELPVESRRHLYLAYRRDYILQPHIKAFCRFVETASQ